MAAKATLLLAALATPVSIWLVSSGESFPSQLFDYGPGAQGEVAEAESLLDAQAWIFANGVVEGRARQVPLRFELTGRLVAVEVEAGQEVRKAQVLARLDCSQWQHELAKAKAARARAKAEKRRLLDGATLQERDRARADVKAATAKAVQMQDSYRRMQKAVKLGTGAVTAEKLNTALGEYRVAYAHVKAARAHLAALEAPPRSHELEAADAEIALQDAQVAQANTMLARAVLRAPTDGVILRVSAEPGEIVGPQSNRSLLTLADQSETRVRAYVEELDALHVRCGRRAYIQADGLPDTKFWGTVLTCLPSMQPKAHFSHRPDERSDVKVREVVICLDEPCTTESAQPLVVGLPVDVHIAVKESLSPAGLPHDSLEPEQIAASGATYPHDPCHEVKAAAHQDKFTATRAAP